mmetsp:Transcript_140541/g.437054  ORF Transcript_140541/g.437054 Transcript_140541/m.437054 type:complete len:201 (+) Transcript_140541:804-1406(+)
MAALGSPSLAAALRHASSKARSLQTIRRNADMRQTMPGAMAGEPVAAQSSSYTDKSLPVIPSMAKNMPPPHATYTVPSAPTTGLLKSGVRWKSSAWLPGKQFLRTTGMERDQFSTGESTSSPTSLPDQKSPTQSLPSGPCSVSLAGRMPALPKATMSMGLQRGGVFGATTGGVKHSSSKTFSHLRMPLPASWHRMMHFPP